MAGVDLRRIRRAASPGRRPASASSVSGAGDRVVLMMRNRPEFHVAGHGRACCCGATPISIYNSSAPEQVEYLVGHCEAEVAIVEDDGYLERFLKVRDELPALEHIVHRRRPRRRRRRRRAPRATAARPRPARPRRGRGQTAIPTTSPRHLHVGHHGPAQGRDARPRQHLLDGRVPASSSHARRRRSPASGVVSYLPMAHIAERMTSPLPAGDRLRLRGRPASRDPRKIAAYLAPRCGPNIFFGVPRVWEKMYAGRPAPRSPPIPTKASSSTRRVEVGQPIVERDGAEHGDTAEHDDLRVPRRGGVRAGPRAARARPGRARHHRRRADPGRDPRVLPRPRRAARPRSTACRSRRGR